MNLAVILARGGSKRLPGKNIGNFAGKPLIAHTIIAAQESGIFNKIVVSSDDSQILEVAHEYSAETILRPAELAGDSAKSIDAVAHAVDYLGGDFENIWLLQPTSPLRDKADIRAANALFKRKLICSADGVNPNGAIYVWRKELLLDEAIPKEIYLMPPERSVDIDTLEDFLAAESIFKNLAGK